MAPSLIGAGLQHIFPLSVLKISLLFRLFLKVLVDIYFSPDQPVHKKATRGVIVVSLVFRPRYNDSSMVHSLLPVFPSSDKQSCQLGLGVPTCPIPTIWAR